MGPAMCNAFLRSRQKLNRDLYTSALSPLSAVNLPVIKSLNKVIREVSDVIRYIDRWLFITSHGLHLALSW